jgi:hypothetical protein
MNKLFFTNGLVRRANRQSGPAKSTENEAGRRVHDFIGANSLNRAKKTPIAWRE